MKKPSEWGWVVSAGQLMASVLYFSVGWIGALALKDDADSNVLSNLHGVEQIISVVFILVHVVSAFPAVLSSSFVALDQLSDFWIARICMRSALVLLGLGFAEIFAEKFGAFLGFIGSGTVVLGVFVLPVVFMFKARRDAGIKTPVWEYVVGICVVLFGIAAGILGLISSVQDLVKVF
jgi:uncharacterized membrane protein